MREAASPAKLKRVIDNLPDAGLVDLFAHFVRTCMKRKVFGGKMVSEVAKTIEMQALGKYRAAPNQSQMPKTRPESMAAATEAALTEIKPVLK